MAFYVFSVDENEPVVFDTNQEAAEYMREFIDTGGYTIRDFVVIKGDRMTLEAVRIVDVIIGGG